MNNIQAFEDSSLRDIQFINFGKDLMVGFDSSYDGEYIGALVCKDVLLFEYRDTDREFINSNLLEIDQGFFASYIGTILIKKIDDYYEIKFEPIPNNIVIHCLNYEIVTVEN